MKKALLIILILLLSCGIIAANEYMVSIDNEITFSNHEIVVDEIDLIGLENSFPNLKYQEPYPGGYVYSATLESEAIIVYTDKQRDASSIQIRFADSQSDNTISFSCSDGKQIVLKTDINYLDLLDYLENEGITFEQRSTGPESVNIFMFNLSSHTIVSLAHSGHSNSIISMQFSKTE